MSAKQLNDLWNIVRENEKTIAVLQEKLGAQDDVLRKLVDDNEAMRKILYQAIGAKTVASIVGAAVVAIITWCVTYFSGK